jgi:hypothetical protein
MRAPVRINLRTPHTFFTTSKSCTASIQPDTFGHPFVCGQNNNSLTVARVPSFLAMAASVPSRSDWGLDRTTRRKLARNSRYSRDAPHDPMRAATCPSRGRADGRVIAHTIALCRHTQRTGTPSMHEITNQFMRKTFRSCWPIMFAEQSELRLTRTARVEWLFRLGQEWDVAVGGYDVVDRTRQKWASGAARGMCESESRKKLVSPRLHCDQFR